MLLKSRDILETAVDAHLHLPLHAMAHVLQRLLLELLPEHRNHSIAHSKEHRVGVALAAQSHSAHDAFEHENILNFSHIGHKYVLVAQILHLLVLAAVAIDDAVAVEVVERAQVAERARGFYYLVAAAERLHGVFGENQRIEARVEAVSLVAFHKKHRFAAAEEVEHKLVAKFG